MTLQEMLEHVDHTQLKPYAGWNEIVKLCEEAIRYHTASVCIPSGYVKKVKETFGSQVRICTVVGFPLGYCNTAGKLSETEAALRDGAEEIDMVINIADAKNGDYDKVEKEIAALKRICGNHVLKVIIETCYLDTHEKVAMCKAVTRAGADYIKTSTGFGTGGATVEDIKLFQEHIGSNVKIKAAGGISTLADLEMFLQLGCERIGTSRAVGFCEGKETEGY